MDTRVVGVIVAVVIVVLGGWLIFAHQNFTSSLSQDQLTSPTSTTPATSPATTTSQANLPDLPTVSANAVGTWQSMDDSNYTVKITAAGKWTDTYASASSSAAETGTYTLFTSANPDPSFTGILEPDVVYVKVVEGSSTIYFSVLAANQNELQLSYLDRGNTLSFVRTQ